NEVQDCLAYTRAYAAHLDLDRGHWEKAAAAAATLIERQNPATAQRVPALLALGLVRARRGDPGVGPLLDEALRLALPTGELQRIGAVAVARAEAAWYRGDLAAVATEAAVGLRAVEGHEDPWMEGELAFWARQADPSIPVSGNLAEPYGLILDGDWETA